MRTVVIYKENSDHAREVIDYLRDFEAQTGENLETVDPDTREGSSLCRLYDVVEYPTIITITDNGDLRQLWRGRPLPQIDQVAYYLLH